VGDERLVSNPVVALYANVLLPLGSVSPLGLPAVSYVITIACIGTQDLRKLLVEVVGVVRLKELRPDVGGE
jgi:hypothetical protein